MSTITIDPDLGTGGTGEEHGFNRDEIVKNAKISLDLLAALAMPNIISHLFPDTLKTVWEILKDKVGLDGFFRLALGIPRGHAKTTLIKLFVLYCILFTNRKFILIICATEPLAVNFLADVCSMLDHPNIVGTFGNWNITKTEDNKQKKLFSFAGRDIVLFATGQGSVRGLNIHNDRPDIIIMDDAQGKENAESETESIALLQWIQSTVMKLNSPTRCLYIYIGNMYRVKNPAVCILAKLKENPLWVSFITGAILIDGKPLWEKLHSLERLLEEFENDSNMGTPEVFLSECMNDVDYSITSVIDLTKVPISPYTNRNEATGRYLIIDVATDKPKADDTVIGCYGIYDGHHVLEEIDFGRFSPKETIEKSFAICFRTGANVIAVEDAAYQSSLLFWFSEMANEIELSGIEFVPVKPGGITKMGRILLYLTQLMKGEVYVSWDVRAFLFKEISELNPNKKNNTDNICDMAAYWQKVTMLYGHLIAFLHAPGQQEYSSVGVAENNTSF